MASLTSPAELDVLIVGAGPAGAALASFLAQNNVTNGLCISSAPSTAREPRAHYTNLATMDALRDLGLEQEAYSQAQYGETVSHIRWGDTMAGIEYGRAWLGGNKPDRWSEYAAASPCHTCDLPQTLMEPMLVKYATTHGFAVRFSTTFLSFEQREDGRIVSRLKDLITGVEYEVVSKYLCGADGGRSTVAKLLDLPMVSQPGPPAYNISVSVDMTKLMRHRPGSLHYCLKISGTSRPFIPLWRAVKPWTEWILIIFPKPGQQYDQPDNNFWMEVIHETIGDESVSKDAKITGVSRWVVNEIFAEQYDNFDQEGNIFCLGDAVHRHPPTGGLGSNTCIQDAYNLAWKMALVLKGHAGNGLLETYGAERQPVGRHVVERANESLRNYAPIFDALGVMLPDAKGREKAISRLVGDEEGDKTWRKQLRDGLVRVADQEMQALGTEMGQLYSSAAIYCEDEQKPFEVHGKEAEDPKAFYTPSIYPGRRLPHVWLDKSNPSGRTSTLDLVGKGAFCLLTGPVGAGNWKDAVKDVEKTLAGVKIKAYSIGFGQDWEDVYGDWAKVCEISGCPEVAEGGAALIRPDGFVAWRTEDCDENREHRLGRAMRQLLALD